MTKILTKKTTITILGWVISGVLIASLFASMDFKALTKSLKDAQWSYLALATLINLFVMGVKALRWQIIMVPGLLSRKEKLKSDFVQTDAESLHTSCSIVMTYWTILQTAFIGMAGNNILPARGGDWFRIYLLGKWSGMSKAALASVTGLDKLFDGVAILTLFALLSLHSFHFGRDIPALPNWVEDGAMIISMVIAASLVISFALLYHHRKTHHKESGGRISKLIKNLGSGMDILSKKRLVAWTIIVSLASTFLQIITLWTCQQAFHVEFNLWITAIVFIAINLAIIIPSAPSGVGPFEAAAVLTLSLIHI